MEVFWGQPLQSIEEVHATGLFIFVKTLQSAQLLVPESGILTFLTLEIVHDPVFHEWKGAGWNRIREGGAG